MKKYLSILFVSVLFGCATPPPGGQPVDQLQQSINLTYNSYTALNAAISAADLALKSGALKPADAQKASVGFHAAVMGLDAALAALPAASAASGVAK